jgi:DNA-binding transcriptional MerR regulator
MQERPERPLDEWLTKAEAAAALGCSTRTIERHEADGLLPSVMRAGRRWYHRDIVEAFDAKRKEAPQRLSAASTRER